MQSHCQEYCFRVVAYRPETGSVVTQVSRVEADNAIDAAGALIELIKWQFDGWMVPLPALISEREYFEQRRALEI